MMDVSEEIVDQVVDPVYFEIDSAFADMWSLGLDQAQNPVSVDTHYPVDRWLR